MLLNILAWGAGGRSKIIDHFDEYLITLVYIREGMTMRFWAHWFGVSKSSVTCIINTWINLLFTKLKCWLKWPSANEVKNELPKSYPVEYGDTRIILDCTEFFLVKQKIVLPKPVHILSIDTTTLSKF